LDPDKWYQRFESILLHYNRLLDLGGIYFLSKIIATFAIGCSEHYKPADEGWGPPGA